MGFPQMGQRCDVDGVGTGTVRIGRRVVDEIGGSERIDFWEAGLDGRFVSFSSLLCALFDRFGRGRRFGSMGGGSSIFSAAFLESCRAKSEACHHSRNLSANILVGSSIRRLDNNRGYTVLAIFLGLKIEPPSPGLAGPNFEGCVAISIAL